MATKRLHELNLTDEGVKARLEELSGSLGGLFFEHTEPAHGHCLRLANLQECQMDDEGCHAEPEPADGPTVDAAAARLLGNLRKWCARVERRVSVFGLEAGQPSRIYRMALNEQRELKVEQSRAVLPRPSVAEPFTNGFNADMALDLGLYRL